MSETKPDRQQTATYPLRMPAELKQWVQERATTNRRSFNAEVVVTLEAAQKQQEAQGAPQT